MKKIKIIVIDDERLAREEIKHALRSYSEFDVIAEAANADDAKKQIEILHPDVIFLDVQMPEKSGFDLLESLSLVPIVIFTTAFDKYAVKAFEVSALDYLMKPIREERLAKAIEQVRNKLKLNTADPQIFIKDRNQYHFISWNKVYFIESVDNYARLYFDNKKVLMKSSLNQLEKKLDGSKFFRINRAEIINKEFIEKIGLTSKGRLKISLNTGNILEVSERQSAKFKGMTHL